MCCDSVEELLVQLSPMRSITVTLDGEERLERFQRLDRTLKADRSRLNAVLGRCLSHNAADQVVSQNVGPEFLPHEVRRFTAQDIHLECLLK